MPMTASTSSSRDDAALSRLLDYLRTHLEELRPVDVRKRNDVHATEKGNVGSR